MLTKIRAALAGRYVLEREIGRGSSASVYAARELKHGRRVALKVIAADVVNTLDAHRFLQEIRTTARLNHPHILPLFDSGDAEGFIFFTMPLVEGQSLRHRLDELGCLPLDEAVPLVTQIASALSYAHSTGIVHRDIKPENVLIGHSGHAWVADFGLARAFASGLDQRLTGTAMTVGSPHYMSPEQAAGERDVDGRSDTYSLGCITFELLCGTPPFSASTVSSLLARHLTEAAPSILDRAPGIPAHVDRAIGRAMAKDRMHRFGDARDFAAGLQNGKAVEAPDDTHAALPARIAGPPHDAGDPRQRIMRLQTLRNRLSDLLKRIADRFRRTFHRGTPLRTGDTRADAPPQAGGVHAAPWQRSELPGTATPFVGREDELRELRELICSPADRLVTVTGPGGVGKTRLALHAAQQLTSTFQDGVTYVPLSGLAASDLLIPTLAESLGIHLSRREDPEGELKAYLHGKQMLIVLDNFEHLMNSAAALPRLLDHAPGLHILVTSRERLNLQHETLITLDGLSIGDGGGDAVELFVNGAQRLDRHFHIDADNRATVVRICELLDGIPLAIELASAWIRALSCVEILAGLERDLDVLASEAPDIEKRHHSLRATFEASWRLLSTAEQSALARLAVFRSAFDSPLAAQVADADVLLLRQLVDKSLLTRAGDRLLMLDVVRAYALERLAADPDIERRARERHLACLSAMLHSLEDDVQRADATAIRRVADSIDDARAAWMYANQTNNAGALLSAMDGLFHFYEARGWAREGAETFARSRAMLVDSSGSPHSRSRPARLAAARLTTRHGVMLHRLGDLPAAESLLRQGVEAARELDDENELVFALHRLGAVRHGMGDYDESERLHREGWQCAERLEDQLAVGWSMTYLGNVEWSRGEFEEATRLYTNGLELLREENDLNGMWVTLNNLGVLAASRQQYVEAQRRLREGLALQAELGNPRHGAHVLHNLGCAARELGDLPHAREWLEESLEISERMGYQGMAGLTLVGLAELAIRENDDAAAVTAAHRALRTARTARSDPLALEALLTLARLRLREGDTPGAVDLAGVISSHPGSDRDLRRRTAELFAEIGVEPQVPVDADLAHVIDRITGSRSRTTAGMEMSMHSTNIRPTMHARAREDS
ncbi:MAG: protein kinase [Gemmatimonadetes bacterium]|nr:protein kinase [Gemmatimonadota bacterium]